MSTSGAVVASFSEAVGVSPYVIEGLLHHLRAADLVPMGARGGSQKVGRYEPRHLANVLMALAAPHPGDAARVVRGLRALLGNRLDQLVETGGGGSTVVLGTHPFRAEIRREGANAEVYGSAPASGVLTLISERLLAMCSELAEAA